jgi:hypothetical protein
MVRHYPKRFGKSRPENPQLFPVQNRKLVQHFLPMRRQFNENQAMVLITGAPSYGPALHEAVDQFDRTVMAQAQPLRERRDSGASSRRQTFNGKKNLMLLWLNADGSGSLFAEVEELADAISKFRELAVSR